MATLHDSVMNFAREAKKENKAMEKVVLLNPLFRKVKGELITLVGRC